MGTVHAYLSQEAKKGGDQKKKTRKARLGRAEDNASIPQDRMFRGNAEQVKQFQTWLTTLKVQRAKNLKKRVTKNSPAFRVRWRDLMSVESKGKWWLVGSSWRSEGMDGDALLGKENGEDEAFSGDSEDEGGSSSRSQPREGLTVRGRAVDPQILRLAKKQGMNTDRRRLIFASIVTSQSVDEAFENLQKMNLRGSATRDFVRIALDCGLKQNPFNSFYPILILRLCEGDKQHKLTLQYTVWDVLKQIENVPSQRQAINLGRMCGLFVSHFALSLSFVKVITLSDLQEPNMHLFFFTMMAHLMTPQHTEEHTFLAVLNRIGSSKDTEIIHSLLHTFLEENTKTMAKACSSKEDRQLIRRRGQKAQRILQKMALALARQGEDD
jgi:nucleolar MIF4G domain-containing protein 1